MAVFFKRSTPKERLERPSRNWRGTASRVTKIAAIALLAVTVLGLGISGGNLASRLSALLCVAVFVMSFAYLLAITRYVHISFFDLDELIEGRSASQFAEDKDQPNKKGKGPLKSAKDSLSRSGETVTLQVTRLDTSASFATVTNDSWLPVLHGELGLVMSSLDEGGAAQTPLTRSVIKSAAFSLPARSSLPDVSASTFNHVGIFNLHSDGVRLYDFFGILSKTSGPSGDWRVRVVPNIYRLTGGVSESRKTSQISEGIPDTPMDALDYDRVRDYRPGDSLRKIHWKLVAHRQGELYTKLFEDSRFSTVTLLVDPYGANTNTTSPDHGYYQHDTMLEGGFSLIEHARESGLLGRLRFVNRSGALVESNWEGWASLGWFVEVAKRPESSQEALSQSTVAIQSLSTGSAGYTIFTTSRLTERSVRELIAVHHSGVPLLVLHALPSQNSSELSQQKTFDDRLRRASIVVISLTDGKQIIQEVAQR